MMRLYDGKILISQLLNNENNQMSFKNLQKRVSSLVSHLVFVSSVVDTSLNRQNSQIKNEFCIIDEITKIAHSGPFF